jgi:uncharacterized protein YecT (DUF1311 family)
VRSIIPLMAILTLAACQSEEPTPAKQAAEPAFECGTKPNGVQITECLEKQINASSNRVQTALARNLKEAAAADKELAEFEGPAGSFDPNTHVDGVKASQLAWEKYADMQCTLESYQALGGTAQDHFYMRCLDRLNLQRLKDLRSPFMLESQRLKPVPEE